MKTPARVIDGNVVVTPPGAGTAKRVAAHQQRAATRRTLIALSIVLAAACSTPGGQLNDRALQRGYQVVDVDTGSRALTVYRSPHQEPGDGRWHVYLDGDGTPWHRGRSPARDPTARNSLVLDLMDADSRPRLLLHRPCYGRRTLPENCTPALWTYARYSGTVVAEMDAALDILRDQWGVREIVLIGYSGGGTLGRLLAARREDVVALVTVAANLDHAAWTRHHGYQPLTSSLRVTDMPPLEAGILQWHLAGEEDAVVPPAVTRRGLARDRHARLEIIPGFDHRCCWPAIWPERLRSLQDELATK